MAFRVNGKYAYRTYNQTNKTLASLGRMSTKEFLSALKESLHSLKTDAFDADCENADRIHSIEMALDPLIELTGKLVKENNDLRVTLLNLHARLDRAGIAR